MVFSSSLPARSLAFENTGAAGPDKPFATSPRRGNPHCMGTGMVLRLTLAYAFAAEQHRDQRRKGDAAEPYINHVIEVAQLAAEATGGRDIDLVIAAVLHDVVEDTPASFADLESRFGSDVAGLVRECTDDASLPKAERKRLQVVSAPGKSARAKIIKLADKTSNLRALVESPPSAWPVDRRLGYVAWARDVAGGLEGVNPWLEAQFAAAADAAERHFRGSAPS
jgi:HD domain